MNAHEREAIRQAKILRAQPDPTGLGHDILGLVCKFKVNNVCQTQSFHLEYDPTGEFNLPAPACGNCHRYIDGCWQKDIKSEEAHHRLTYAIARTYEALRKLGK